MLFIDDDTESLSASSLVCSTWNAVSQRLLFEHVHPLDLFRLLELNDVQMREFQPLFPRFRRLSLSRLAFVDATTAGKAEEYNVNARSFMFRALVRPESSIHYHRYLSVADTVLPSISHSFQLISTLKIDGPMEFESCIIFRDFLAGFANLEHLAFCFKFAKVTKESSLPAWTGLRLRSLQCRAQLVDSGLVHALLSWLAASDSPRLTTLCVGLRESRISPACYVRDPMKKLLETSKATLRTLEVDISSSRSHTCEYIIVQDALVLISFLHRRGPSILDVADSRLWYRNVASLRELQRLVHCDGWRCSASLASSGSDRRGRQ
jgi:hypothetical protein